MIKYENINLKNGLRAYVLPCNLGTNVVSVNVFYKVGSRNETLGKSGIAHMLEHLNFKSTKNLKAGEFDEIVRDFGGINNASTGFDKTHYYIKCSTKNTRKSLELFAEMMENLSLKEEEFLPERDVVYEERLLRTDNNPLGYLFFKLYNNAFSSHSYHWTPIGFKEDILSWTIDDIKKFWEQFYQPSNAVVVVSGDVDAIQTLQIIKNIFENIKNKTIKPILRNFTEEHDEKKMVEIASKSNIGLLMQGYYIPPYNHEDILSLEILSNVLSNLKSSRINKKLLDEMGLINECGVMIEDCLEENLMIIFAACNENVDVLKVKNEIDKIIFNINKIDDFELEKVITNYKLSLKLALNNASSLASLFGKYALFGDINALLQQIKNLDKITSKTIKKVAQKYIISSNEVCVYMKGA